VYQPDQLVTYASTTYDTWQRKQYSRERASNVESRFIVAKNVNSQPDKYQFVVRLPLLSSSHLPPPFSFCY